MSNSFLPFSSVQILTGLLSYRSNMIHHTTKPTRPVHPAKTWISLGIHPVWSESSLSAWRNLGSLATHWAHSKVWSGWADAKTDRSLRLVHRIFCWFCCALAQICLFSKYGLISSWYCVVELCCEKNKLKLVPNNWLFHDQELNSGSTVWWTDMLPTAQQWLFWSCMAVLTHICPVNLSILINWTSPFPDFGVSGVLFHFYSISNRNSCEQTVQTMVRQNASSDLGLHCLPRSEKCTCIW